MKPIIFSRSDVALMLKVALLFNPSFLDGMRFSRSQVRSLTSGRMRPAAYVLNRLNLTATKEGYQWHA